MIVSKTDLKKTFDYIDNEEYQGVKGVIKFDSKKEGPNLGITILTHGNEPSGLASLYFFLKNDYFKKLKKGSVTFILNNAEAGRKYFDSKSFEEGLKYRFIDLNLNRLPRDLLELKNDERYEIKRVQELDKIYREIDIGFDIHSTTSDSDPMILIDKNTPFEFFKGFPIEKVITNIIDILVGTPVVKFLGGIDKDIPKLIIEAGQHEKEEAFEIAIKSTVFLLKNLGMLEDDSFIQKKHDYFEYKVNNTVLFPNESYELIKIFSPFEKVKKGDLIAKGNQKDILANCNGHILMPPIYKKPIRYTEEILFITEESKKFGKI